MASVSTTVVRRPAFKQTRNERMVNLSGANQVRMRRAKLKDDLKGMTPVAGAHAVARLIADNDQQVRSMKVAELIAAVRMMGPMKAEDMLYELDIRHSARVRSLNVRKRVALATRLRMHGSTGLSAKEPLDHLPPPDGQNPRRPAHLRCSECGEHLQKPGRDGRCGFCQKGLGAT